LPVEDLLYVGAATQKKLNGINVYTIGQLANTNPELLRSMMGKWGLVLHLFANGHDESPVTNQDVESQIKGIGNSSTAPRDLVCDEDVKILYYVLCESVAERLRENGFRARTVQISVRDKELVSFNRQGKLPQATNLSVELAKKAMELFRAHYKWVKPIRSIGVRATDLIPIQDDIQLSFLEDKEKLTRMERLEATVDDLRRRYGHYAITRGALLGDKTLNSVNPKDDHNIHPIGFFNDKVSV
jgi:DNA polymerase-4